MAQLSINVGSTDYAGDGESLRNALIKVNTNFTEVYADISSLQTSVSNSFDGDYNSLTNKPTIPTALSDLTNDLDYASIVGSAIQNNGLPVLSTQNLDISGSVFADDSTLLVDAVNGKIVGPIETSSLILNTLSLPILSSAPLNPTEGMIAWSDGSWGNATPGTTRALVAYIDNGFAIVDWVVIFEV